MAETGSNGANGPPLLRVENLAKHYPMGRKGLFAGRSPDLKAVDGVSFELNAGETVGLVGESGCGKSTLAKTLLRLVEPTAGRVLYRGQDILTLSEEEMRRLRRKIQIVFQDPYASLNPRMTVGEILSEPWRVFPDIVPRSRWKDRIGELLTQVGLRPGDAERHPHQFSGGQRQRIGIARALALEPEIILCDEPVSALDVSVQAQVINLLEQLRDELGLAYIFIAHDLSVVRHIADRVLVMYLGKVVEEGRVDEVFEHPLHPYTEALLSAVPTPDPALKGQREIIVLEGEVPSPVDPPKGCPFHPRCLYAQAECRSLVPESRVTSMGHAARCHFAGELEMRSVAGPPMRSTSAARAES